MYALIIAGGEGQRLRPHTEDRPKGMVPINGKPLLEYSLDWLRTNGVDQVVIVCGYRADMLKEYFKDGRQRDQHIEYYVEETPLGRGGAFKKGFSFVPPSEELVIGMNGDNLNTQDLGPMFEMHRAKSAAVTVLLTQLRSPYGIADLTADGRITGFAEKPLLPNWLNAGVYVISSDVFSKFPDHGDHEDSTFPELAREGRLFGFRSTAYWRAVDTVKDLLEAGKELKELG